MTEERYNAIIDYLWKVLKGTQFENHVFSVGGCERDRILGNTIKDIDLVVDIKDGGIKLANFLQKNGHTRGNVVIYEHFGTAMFALKEFPGEELEAVQTRSECYHDMKSRNPDTSFGTIEEDCHRRDFTINAVYRNVSTGEVLDLNGNSFKDLEFQIIRTCGDPDIIFSEDPLRILRLLRFYAKLGFSIDEATMKGALKHKNRLSIISKERITEEFNKILYSENAGNVLSKMKRMGLFPYVYGFSDSIPVIDDEIANYIARSNGNLILGLTSLFWKIEPLRTEEILRKMKYSNNVIKDVLFLKKMCSNEIPKSDKEIRRLIYNCISFERLCMVLSMYEVLGVNGKYISQKALWSPDFSSMFGHRLPIDGFGVMEALNKIEGSPIIKTILNELREMAFENPHITKEDCITYIKNRKV